MAGISESVCLNHPDTPAVTRCATCGKPICAECIVTRNGSHYCSTACAASAELTADRVGQVQEARARSERRRGRRALVMLIVLLVLAAVAYYFYSRNREEVEQIGAWAADGIRSGANEAGQAVAEGIPTDSRYKQERENLVR